MGLLAFEGKDDQWSAKASLASFQPWLDVRARHENSDDTAKQQGGGVIIPYYTCQVLYSHSCCVAFPPARDTQPVTIRYHPFLSQRCATCGLKGDVTRICVKFWPRPSIPWMHPS